MTNTDKMFSSTWYLGVSNSWRESGLGIQHTLWAIWGLSGE